jgi:hypothetical protein
LPPARPCEKATAEVWTRPILASRTSADNDHTTTLPARFSISEEIAALAPARDLLMRWREERLQVRSGFGGTRN